MNNLQILKDKQEHVVELVRRWGDVNTDAILDPHCITYVHPSIEGLIGYRVESGFAIVYGDPVCAPENKIALAQTFHDRCEEQGLKLIYAMASEEFTDQAMGHLCKVLIEFGEKLVIDPLNNPMNSSGSKAGLVRKKVKRALNEGVMVSEYVGQDPQIEQEIEELGRIWVKDRHGPQIFISHPSFFADRFGKRWFYARHQGQMVGLILLNQLQSKEGWLLNNLMTTKTAPQGTSELLVMSALQTLEHEGCRFVLCGPVPGNKLGKIAGLGRFSTRLTHLSFNVARRIFHLDGHSTFWEKFQPQTEPCYLLFDQKQISMGTLKGLMRGLNASI